MQSKEERVHGVFENIHDNYDKMNSIISFKQHLKWRKETMKKMDVKKGDTALDVCCGTGDWAIALADSVGPEGKVYGLDFSKNMLKIAEEKTKSKELTQLELIHGNAMELPFEDDTFDYVTIGFGLRNVPDYMQVLKKCTELSNQVAWSFAWKPRSRRLRYIASSFMSTSAISCLFSERFLRKAIKNIHGYRSLRVIFREWTNLPKCFGKRA